MDGWMNGWMRVFVCMYVCMDVRMSVWICAFGIVVFEVITANTFLSMSGPFHRM